MSRKNTRSWFSLVLLSVAFLGGCTGAPPSSSDGGEPTGESSDAYIASNSLLPEALTHGGRFADAPLSPDVMSPESIAAIEEASNDGYYARLFLKYAVGCALGPGQSFAFSWTDERGPHPEVYEGATGLAPSWATQPLDEIGRAWVSACMLARTNRYGIKVEISMRGEASPLVASVEEMSEYERQEGAFWGDLFAPEPRAVACYVPENVDHAHDDQRDCASGRLPNEIDPEGHEREDCGIVDVVGPCDQVCDPLASGLYHPLCGLPSAEKTKYVITVFLR